MTRKYPRLTPLAGSPRMRSATARAASFKSFSPLWMRSAASLYPIRPSHEFSRLVFSLAATVERKQIFPMRCAGKQPEGPQQASVTQMAKGHLGGPLEFRLR